MFIVQWLNALDDLLFELMGWLLFYPLTLAKMVRRPLATMRYAEEQLKLPEEEQFRGTVSPPIMLILTVVIMQAVGTALGGGTSPIVAHKTGLSGLVNDNMTLLLLKLVLFALFALVLSTHKVRRSGVEVTRDTLKAPFYAQCYAISPFALLGTTGVTVVVLETSSQVLPLVGWSLLAAAFLFYGVVQTRWFSQELKQPHWRSFLDASAGIIVSLILTVCLGLLFH